MRNSPVAQAHKQRGQRTVPIADNCSPCRSASVFKWW